MGQINLPSNILDRMKRLEKELAEVRKAIGLSSATITHGDLTIKGGNLNIQDSGSIVLPLGGAIRDASNEILFSADRTNGGRLSTPFLVVPIWPRWNPGGAGGPGFQSPVSTGDWTMAASACTSEVSLWEGRIPQALHPQLKVVGVFGRVTGTTSVPTYRARIQGQLVGTWSQTEYNPGSSPPFDITDVTQFGGESGKLEITMQADVSSDDNLACSAVAILCGK